MGVKEILHADEFEAWFEGLDRQEKKAVYSVIDKLDAMWLQLGYPHASALEGTAMALRELRHREEGGRVQESGAEKDVAAPSRRAQTPDPVGTGLTGVRRT